MSYNIEPVPWDSKFFDFPVAQVQLPSDFSHSRLKEALDKVKSLYRLVYITVEHDGPEEISGFEAPCVCYDRKIVYATHTVSPAPAVDARIYAHTDMTCPKRLEILAVLSGTHSRFLKDPQLSPFYERLFLTWVNGSITGGLADAVWVWQGDDGKPAGLVTARCFKTHDPKTGETNKEGRVGLLAVAPEYRKRGAGFALLGACNYWADSIGVPTISLATQKDNLAVCNLCLKSGFKPTSEISIYHYWPPGWSYNPRRGWCCSEK